MRQDKSALTAISRNKPSLPMQYLNKTNLLYGSKLDYGCGKGFDAFHFNMDKYDPNWHPIMPSYNYDTITCNYVINVIENDTDVFACLKNIQNLLSQNGTAYISIRRDVKQLGLTHKGTYQSNIHLNLHSLKRTSSYEIYVLKKDTDLFGLKIERK